MKTFLSDKPTQFALLLIGAAGGGKSTLACRFPRPYVISLDRNLRGPAAQMLAEGRTSIAYDDLIIWDEKGIVRPKEVQYSYFNQSFNAGYTDPSIDTIVIDNVTQLCDIILADCLRQSKTTSGRPELKTWGEFLYAWKELLLKTRACAKRVIYIAHEKVEKDELTGVLRYFLAVPGQTAQILPTLFTDIWRCEMEETYVQGRPVHKRIVRVLQNQMHEYMKTSIPSLPATFEATQTELDRILAII